MATNSELDECTGSEPVDSMSDQSLIKEQKPTKSERKKIIRLEKIASKKACRKQKKTERKERLRAEKRKADDGTEESEASLDKRARLKLIKERMRESLVSGQRICIDCSLNDYMSAKEESKLCQQLMRAYGSNRQADQPAHMYFTSLQKNSQLYSECVRKCSGFENYMVDMRGESYKEVFSALDIVYLSPDSANVLTEVRKDKVYVIGGLVDETKHKNITEGLADTIHTARLPLQEYMTRSEEHSTFSLILTVNQVFDILLTFTQTQDWKEALSANVPKRSGYVLK